MSPKVISLVGLAALVSAGSAVAQRMHPWSVKAGYNQFYPQVKSGDVTGIPNGKVDVSAGGAIFGSVAYAFDENLSAELAFGFPPKLDIQGRGTIEAAGTIADVKVFAPILMMQYRLGAASSSFRPYLGLGATYTVYRNVTTKPVLSALTGISTTASIDKAWGWVGQLGATYELDSRWFLDGSVVPMRVKTTARLSTGQQVDVKVNPILVNIAVGRRF